MFDDNEIIANDEVDEITRAAREESSKGANKPMIDHLPDAVTTDEMGMPVLLAGPGEKIVIERVASVLSHRPWLDTRTYTITSIDAASGWIGLWDDVYHRDAGSNYIEGMKVGYRFKLAAAKGPSIGERKRGRPKKNPTGAPVPEKPVELGPDGKPVQKRRGRPKGSKNRERGEIMAEKKAKLEKRRTKRGAK